MASTVFPAPGGGVTQKIQEFTSTGSFVVPSNCTTVQVFLVGGGGGGGYVLNDSGSGAFAAGGGAGGEVIEQFLPVTAGASYTVTIGGGGAGATTRTNVGTGITSSFGSLLFAYGGGGGGSFTQSVDRYTPGRGGGGASGTTGSSNCAGGAGGPATASVSYSGVIANVSSLWTYTNQRQTAGGLSFVNNYQIVSQTAGIGLYGYGNGGAGGVVLNSNGSSYGRVDFYGTGYPSFWDTNTSTRTNGVAASTNTGDGGHGGITTNTINTGQSGVAGGSGFARVIYWS